MRKMGRLGPRDDLERDLDSRDVIECVDDDEAERDEEDDPGGDDVGGDEEGDPRHHHEDGRGLQEAIV